MQTQRFSRLFSAVLTVPVVLVGFAAPVAAQTTVSPTTRREQIQQNVQERVANRCERVTERINNRIGQYDENKQKHINRYEALSDKVTALVARLDEKGYDTAKIKTDLQTLDGMIREFAGTYTSFINKLKDAKTYACGNSEGQFREAVEEALELLRDSRQQAKDIADFLKTTIKQDLQDLRNQNPA